jgi:endonuclease/exonuclease/phosphatase (EEP) superfamily protein YafD
MIPIDHALFSGGLVLVERRTGPPFGSAHRPLLVTVAAAG